MIGFENSVSVSELVRAAQAGNVEAFGELIERFRSRMIAWALVILKDYDEAEDLGQEASIRAWENIDQVTQPEAFAGWLSTMTRRLAYSRWSRRVLQFDGDLSIAEYLESREGTSVDPLFLEETRAEVRQGLERLGKLDRATLVARFFDEMSLEEMAEAFNAPLGTIKRRLHVARHRLAEQMQATMSV